MNKQDAQKINEALELLNEAAHGQKDELTKLMSNKFKDLKSAISELESKAEAGAKDGLEHLQALREAAAEQTRTTAEKVDKKVHDDPWKTLGLTVVGAFAIGLLLGRKD